jgi:hypothetical protein
VQTKGVFIALYKGRIQMPPGKKRVKSQGVGALNNLHIAGGKEKEALCSSAAELQGAVVP